MVEDTVEYLADLFKEVVLFDVNCEGGLQGLVTENGLQLNRIQSQVDFMENNMFKGMLKPDSACDLNKMEAFAPLNYIAK